MTYEAEVLADSPTLYWRLGEPSGTTAADDSGNGNGGTYINGPTLGATGLLASDPGDTAMSVAYQNTFVASQYVSSTGLFGASGFNDISVEAWINTSSFNQGATIAGFDPIASAGDFLLYQTPDGVVHFVGAGDVNSFPQCVSAPLSLATTYHVVGTYGLISGTWTATLYVNGAAVDSKVGDGNLDFTTNMVFYAGSDEFDQDAFDGTVDEVAFYPSNLSALRVNAHYLAGSSVSANATVTPAAVHSTGTVGTILLSGAPSTTTQFRLSEFLLARLKFTPAQKYRAVPQIQNFVTHVTALPAIAEITQTPLAVLFDAFDGDEWNMFTMNSDGTARTQVTDH